VRLAALVCGLLLATAGCSGGPPEDDDPTVTAADVPDLTGAPTPTPGVTSTATPALTITERTRATIDRPTAVPNATVDGVSFPSGTDGRGIVNRRSLLAAHEEVAATEGYVLVVNETRKSLTDDESRVVEDSHVVYRVTRNGPIDVHVRQRDDDGNRTIDVYANESGVFTRERSDGNVTYERSPPVTLDDVRIGVATGRLSRHLDEGDWLPIGRTSVDGRPAVAFGFEPESADAERSRGELVVTERGVIRSLTYRTVSTVRDERRVVAVTYLFEPIQGMVVVPPDWLGAAAAAENRTSGGSGSTAR